MIPPVLATVLLILPSFITEIDDSLVLGINQLVGHSPTFDTLVSLSLQNDLIKAGVIGACFFAVWFGKNTPEETQRVRKLLLTGLIASVLVVATTRTLSDTIFLPRPFLRSQKLYHLDHDQLVQVSRFAYRVPLDKTSQSRFRELRAGRLWTADLGSFPSDHAGLFVTLSLGIWLASPLFGGIALGWTLVVVLGSKLLNGQHAPVDVAAGIAFALLGISGCHYLARRRSGLDYLAAWTMRHSALSSAVMFVVLFEICSTLFHATSLMHGAATFLKGLGK